RKNDILGNPPERGRAAVPYARPRPCRRRLPRHRRARYVPSSTESRGLEVGLIAPMRPYARFIRIGEGRVYASHPSSERLLARGTRKSSCVGSTRSLGSGRSDRVGCFTRGVSLVSNPEALSSFLAAQENGF